jgi:hypothetical protein
VAPFSGVIDALLQRAPELREALAAGAEAQGRADVVATLETPRTGAAREPDFKRYARAEWPVGG